MAATIEQVYIERNSLAIGFVLMCFKAGLTAGVDTKQRGKTILMVQIDEGIQVSWMCFGSQAAIARRVLPEVDLKWDGTYLGMDSNWVDELAKRFPAVGLPSADELPFEV